MDDHNLYWIWLTQRKGLGARGLRTLADSFGSPEEIWKAEDEALERAGLSQNLRKALLDKDLGAARGVLDRCEETGVRVLTGNDPAYPARLRLQADAPAVLYYKGTLPGEDRPLIGLVGARKADADGLALAHRLGREIAACGGLVVTGMAKGIDAMSAAGALEGGGAVVGVLGCGPDIVYPKENAELFARVAERGCLLSEYPPGVGPNARHFPVRNRLISALSDGVAVVRAAEQSGSLITARWAAEQGRDVYAVPGDPADPLSRGCNALLRDGAFAAASGWDILRRYEFRYPNSVARAICPPLPEATGNGQQGSGIKDQGSGDGGCGSFGSAALRSGRQERDADAVRAAIGRPPEASAADPESSVGAKPPKGMACASEHSSPALPAGPHRGPGAERAYSVRPALPDDLTPVQRQIAEALMEGPLQLDTLIDKTGLPPAQILPQLTLLQIKKLITQKPGKTYELSGG